LRWNMPKFMFRFNNNVLPEYFNNYFVKLETVQFKTVQNS